MRNEPELLVARTGDGAELAVQVQGRGPVLLLLPGQANSHDWWTGLRDAFTDRFTTVTFDYRGTGDSRADEDDTWSMERFAEDAAAVLDAVGAPTASVYGASMGGRVGQVLAGTTDRVDRLVLACTNPGRTLGVPSDPDAARALRSGSAHDVLELMYTPAWFHRGVRSHLLGDRRMTDRARTLHRRASGEHDAAELLRRIVAPTLILHGSEDRMTTPENAEVLHEHIPGSQLHITEGGRHGFFDEFAEDVHARIRAFLSTSSSPAAGRPTRGGA